MKKLLAGAAIALAALASSAQADGHATYPERPIMLMVSYGAGGATDFQARIVTMTAGCCNYQQTRCRGPRWLELAGHSCRCRWLYPWRIQHPPFHRPIHSGRRGIFGR